MTAASPPVRRTYAARVAPGRRREQLLEHALALALARGFHAVTVEAVARAAGVTRPVVYGQFADREQLLAALLARAEERALAQLAPVLPPVPAPEDDVDPDQLLEAGLVAYLEAVRDDPDTWRVILLPPEGAPAELAERVATQHRTVLAALRGLVAWGIERRPGGSPDVDLMARSVLGLAEGAARLLLSDAQRYPVERFRAFTADLLSGLRALGSRPG